MSLRPTRRKCRCCSEFFLPDYRNRDRQHYCTKPACHQASKSASQRKWLAKAVNRHYFRDLENVKRVQAWRKAHPGYWKRRIPASESSQAVGSQELDPVQLSCNVPSSPLRTLQDYCLAQDPCFIGLLSMITGHTLQEDIAPTARRVLEQGRLILGLDPPRATPPKTVPVYDLQTSASCGSAAANPPEL
jgi:hypothetical protein